MKTFISITLIIAPSMREGCKNDFQSSPTPQWAWASSQNQTLELSFANRQLPYLGWLDTKATQKHLLYIKNDSSNIFGRYITWDNKQRSRVDHLIIICSVWQLTIRDINPNQENTKTNVGITYYIYKIPKQITLTTATIHVTDQERISKTQLLPK